MPEEPIKGEEAKQIAPEVRPEEKEQTILERWGISAKELTELIDNNGSLRGMILGYIAEPMLKKMWFETGKAKYIGKHDDHNRMKKGDLIVEYKGHQFDIEVKSLQTKTIKNVDNRWTGKFQCDASDRRTVKFPDGSSIETTLLLSGEFDILAVNLFSFENCWRYVFAKNSDLPHSTWRKYTDYQRAHLIASLIDVSWPPEGIFRDEPFSLLDEVIAEREKGEAKPVVVVEKADKKSRGEAESGQT